MIIYLDDAHPIGDELDTILDGFDMEWDISSDMLGLASGRKPARPGQAVKLARNGSRPRLEFCEALGHGFV